MRWINKFFFWLAGSLINCIIITRSVYRFGIDSNKTLLTPFALSKNVLIAGNGPSLTNCDFRRYVDYDLIFVNRSCSSKMYEIIKPRFHMIIDPKLVNGVWGLGLIEEIKAKNPEVIFILARSWVDNTELRSVLGGSPTVWVETGIIEGVMGAWAKRWRISMLGAGGVVNAALDLVVKSGYRHVVIAGNESTGFFREVLEYPTHWYGVNVDNSSKQISDRFLDLFFIWLSTGNSIEVSKRLASRSDLVVMNLNPSPMFPFYVEK